MICFYGARFVIDVLVKAFAAEDYGQQLFFDLGISTLSFV